MNVMIDNGRILERVKKLLALSQSPNEAEAASALEKAHELLRDYNLSIENITVDSDYAIDAYEQGTRLQSWRLVLLSVLCDCNYCKLLESRDYLQPGDAADTRTIYTLKIAGRPHNIDVCKSLADYLLKAVERLAKVMASGKGKQYISSYKMGLSSNLIERLRQLKQEDSLQATGHELIVRESENVDAFLSQKFDRLRNKTTRARVSQASAYAQGQKDGQNIALNAQVRNQARSDATKALN